MKVDGKLLKRITGGGDKIVARRNYDREDTKFNNDTTFMIMGNDEIVAEPKDTMEQAKHFNSVNQFKTAEEINEMKERGDSEFLWGFYKVKDPNIKNKCRTDEWKKATVYLLFENYIDHAVPIIKEVDDEVEMNLRTRILNYFEITGNNNDCVIASDVYDTLGDCKKKIDNEFKSLNIIKKKSKKGGNTRDKICFWGCKLRVVIETDFIEDEE